MLLLRTTTIKMPPPHTPPPTLLKKTVVSSLIVASYHHHYRSLYFMMTPTSTTTRRFINSSSSTGSTVIPPPPPYKQGQYSDSDPTVREYFYTVDHNGMLFLDDARMKNFTSAFKEQKFLRFFYRNVRVSSASSAYARTFPFTSLCGKERNYIRVTGNGTPFVFTGLSLVKKGKDNDNDKNRGGDDQHSSFEFVYNNTGLMHPFNPASFYEGSNGRLYHEFRGSKAVGFALVRSAIADELSAKFVYDNDNKNKEGDNDDDDSSSSSSPGTTRVPKGFRTEGGEIVPLDFSLVRDQVEEALKST